jgi:RNA polymerase sigma-B factor
MAGAVSSRLSPVPPTVGDGAFPTASTSDAVAASPGRVADALLLELKALTPGTAGESALRTRVIESYLPMAAHLARRFAGRGESLADLTQVAVIGLIKAVDHFDADRGASFAGYAFPTIAGELKRHFRDVVWMVRVPRGLQETRLRVRAGTDELTELNRGTPTLAEVAGCAR